MRARRWLPLLTVFLLAGAGLAACGGGSDDDASSEGSDTTASKADDQKRADGIVLTLADFPSGWTQDESDDDESDDEEENPLDACMGEEAAELESAQTAEADSPDFSRGESTTAGSFSSVLETEADAEKGMRLLRSDRMKECLDQAFTDELGKQTGLEDVEIGDVTVEQASFPNVAEETAALQFVIPITVEAESVNFYADFVFFRQDRVLAGMFMTDVGEPFSSSEAEALARTMAARMKAA
jgi:hypothetical protein